MGWTHRDRILAALNHEEADRVPIDLGGAEFSTMTVPAYKNLQAYLGMSPKCCRSFTRWCIRTRRC